MRLRSHSCSLLPIMLAFRVALAVFLAGAHQKELASRLSGPDAGKREDDLCRRTELATPRGKNYAFSRRACSQATLTISSRDYHTVFYEKVNDVRGPCRRSRLSDVVMKDYAQAQKLHAIEKLRSEVKPPKPWEPEMLRRRFACRLPTKLGTLGMLKISFGHI